MSTMVRASLNLRLFVFFLVASGLFTSGSLEAKDYTNTLRDEDARCRGR